MCLNTLPRYYIFTIEEGENENGGPLAACALGPELPVGKLGKIILSRSAMRAKDLAEY